MASIRGQYRALRRLHQALGSVSDPQFRRELSRGLGAAALKQYSDGFRKGRDPYGKKWAPLKLRRGKPLLDTGRMRASAAIHVRGTSGFELVVTASYASTHQYGAKNIRPVRARMLAWKVRGKKRWYFAKRVTVPRRQMLPERSTGGLGPTWRKAFQREAKAQVREHFKRVRDAKAMGAP